MDFLCPMCLGHDCTGCTFCSAIGAVPTQGMLRAIQRLDALYVEAKGSGNWTDYDDLLPRVAYASEYPRHGPKFIRFQPKDRAA